MHPYIIPDDWWEWERSWCETWSGPPVWSKAQKQHTHRETLLLWEGKENEVTVGVGGGAANVFAVKILWGGGETLGTPLRRVFENELWCIHLHKGDPCSSFSWVDFQRIRVWAFCFSLSPKSCPISISDISWIPWLTLSTTVLHLYCQAIWRKRKHKVFLDVEITLQQNIGIIALYEAH